MRSVIQIVGCALAVLAASVLFLFVARFHDINPIYGVGRGGLLLSKYSVVIMLIFIALVVFFCQHKFVATSKKIAIENKKKQR